MKGLVLFTFLLLLNAPRASAGVIELYDWGLNLDGTTYCGLVGCDNTGLPLPTNIDASGFDFSTGIGAIDITVTGVGVHAIDVLFDHEIDNPINNFFNEFGSANGLPGVEQSWEIDEPDFIFGNIWSNFHISLFDNVNGVPAGLEDDVAMGLGWDFTLSGGDIATIAIRVSKDTPTAGFYLAQTDPDSNDSIYFSGNLNISSTSVPEPSTLAIFGLGLITLSMRRKSS